MAKTAIANFRSAPRCNRQTQLTLRTSNIQAISSNTMSKTPTFAAGGSILAVAVAYLLYIAGFTQHGSLHSSQGISVGHGTLQNKTFELSSIEQHQGLLLAETAFIMYYAPWCDVCQEVLPTFKNVHDQLFRQGVQSSAVNCVDFSELCTQDDVPIFPTFKLAQSGTTEVYNGQREETDMLNYVNEHMKNVK